MSISHDVEINTLLAIELADGTLKKIDKIALLQNNNIFVKHSGYNIEIPENIITSYENNIVLLNFDNYSDYKQFIKKEVARKRGEKLISRLELFLPECRNFEFYEFSRSKKLLRCEILEAGFHYITQRYRKVYQRKYHTFEIFAEIDVKINPNYCFFYSGRKSVFGFFPLNETNKLEIRDFMDSYNADWVKTTREKYNPASFIMNVDIFRVAVMKWSKVFKLFFKSIRRHPENPLDTLNSLIEKYMIKFRRYPIKFEDPVPEEIYLQLFSLWQELIYDIDRYLNVKVSTGKKVATRLIHPVWLWPVVQVELEFEPLYIIPNGERTIIAIFLPRPSEWGFSQYTHLKRIYDLIKRLYYFLRREESIICPYCNSKCKVSDDYCINCGLSLK
ncbi:MAG: hypothetical protein ACFFDN_03720 [Candidatus Hodarchaeota archaeon]